MRFFSLHKKLFSFNGVPFKRQLSSTVLELAVLSYRQQVSNKCKMNVVFWAITSVYSMSLGLEVYTT